MKVSVGDRVFEGSSALVTVSVGVLKKKKIAFRPELPKEKLQAIDRLQMGNMQKVIDPLTPESRVLQIDRIVTLGHAHEFKLVNASLAPILGSPQEARWVAWEMRKAIEVSMR